MGPATRGGCGALCVKVNIPCRGCFGPPAGVADQGAKLVSSIASIYEAKDEKDIARMVNEVADPAGTFLQVRNVKLDVEEKTSPKALEGRTG